MLRLANFTEFRLAISRIFSCVRAVAQVQWYVPRGSQLHQIRLAATVITMRQTLYGLALLLATATASCPSESDASLVAWGDAAAWDSGSVPSIAGANVTVTSGKHVLLSAAEAPASAPLVLGYVEVEAGAKLVFATHADSGIEVHVRGIIVHGLLQAGTEECPISTSVVIELYSDEKLALSARSSPQPVERK